MVVDVIEYRIDRNSGVDTYMQLVQQTKRAMRLGALLPGDRLPTAKQVVNATAINPNTVLRAYRELEREGLVEAVRGRGTFVTGSLARSEASADSQLRADLIAWMRRARDSGLGVEDVAALVDSVAGECFARPETDTTDTSEEEE